MLNKKFEELNRKIEEGLKIPDNEPISYELTIDKTKYKINLYFGTKTLKDINYNVYKEIIRK